MCVCACACVCVHVCVCVCVCVCVSVKGHENGNQELVVGVEQSSDNRHTVDGDCANKYVVEATVFELIVKNYFT